ncbi:MAG: Acetyl-coenzyme A carboxylase carboxyl transferase subunit alpha [Chlamydiales bacterium]|nr:Acetyl-coenzyme A carboxylase carboxyl transferase subunit alpha [Chlamydiales bacterium]MCH9635203.1 Acetyl-coenzyme A carboxylase carboxyl transferase subunit alpha [Chlamydiales bacterium]MCH9703188.1 acetyl-CoA carboxylase carboxyltransferase subunit alpha [Chlamydiota bacterium]
MEILPHEKPIADYEKTIQNFRDQAEENSLFSTKELSDLEKKLADLKKKIYGSLTPWQRVEICRHPERPRSIDFIKNICDDFVELAGDREFRDDPAVVGGFATIGRQKFMVVGQEKGCDTESRLKRNFGMIHPEGYRKALRFAKVAEKFHLPVLFLLDTPGAFPGLTAEERGQGWAIATNLRELSALATPVIVVVIGEGCSGGALGMGVGDMIGMLEHAYYSVISPESCASILWKDPGKKVEAASTLKMQAEDLLDLDVIDTIIAEPQGGAHHDVAATYDCVKRFVLETWEILKDFDPELLLERRYQKFRNMGRYTVDETPSKGSTS